MCPFPPFPGDLCYKEILQLLSLAGKCLAPDIGEQGVAMGTAAVVREGCVSFCSSEAVVRSRGSEQAPQAPGTLQSGVTSFITRGNEGPGRSGQGETWPWWGVSRRPAHLSHPCVAWRAFSFLICKTRMITLSSEGRCEPSRGGWHTIGA